MTNRFHPLTRLVVRVNQPLSHIWLEECSHVEVNLTTGVNVRTAVEHYGYSSRRAIRLIHCHHRLRPSV